MILSSLSENFKIKAIYIISDANFNINIQNTKLNQTCLHLAVMKGEIDVIRCLLQNGADLTLTDHVIIYK